MSVSLTNQKRQFSFIDLIENAMASKYLHLEFVGLFYYFFGLSYWGQQQPYSVSFKVIRFVIFDPINSTERD